MGLRPPGDGAQRHAALAADGRLGLCLGRDLEVRLRQPGRGPLHKVGDAAAGRRRPLRRRPRDRRRSAAPAGLATRLIAIPFMIEMIVAVLSTKISLFLGTSPLPLPPAPPTA